MQEATEQYIVELFEDSNLCCIHAKRVTVQVSSAMAVTALGVR